MENDIFDAIEKCKTYSGMFVLMGEVQIEMVQMPLAVVYGRKSVELDEQYWRAHKLLGSSQMLNNEPERGLSSLKKSVELAPENSNAQLNLASALVQNKKYDEAFQLVEVWLEAQKDFDQLPGLTAIVVEDQEAHESVLRMDRGL